MAVGIATATMSSPICHALRSTRACLDRVDRPLPALRTGDAPTCKRIASSSPSVMSIMRCWHEDVSTDRPVDRSSASSKITLSTLRGMSCHTIQSHQHRPGPVLAVCCQRLRDGQSKLWKRRHHCRSGRPFPRLPGNWHNVGTVSPPAMHGSPLCIPLRASSVAGNPDHMVDLQQVLGIPCSIEELARIPIEHLEKITEIEVLPLPATIGARLSGQRDLRHVSADAQHRRAGPGSPQSAWLRCPDLEFTLPDPPLPAKANKMRICPDLAAHREAAEVT